MIISILIAHYRNYHYFKDCYASIVNQTVDNFEVIIVDDFSTDGSFEQIRELIKGDTRFKLFRNTENKGVGFTKRRCVELANGEICGFVDPDDVLELNAVEISMKAYTNPKILATHSHFGMYNQNLEYLKAFPTTQKVKPFQPHFLNVNFEVNHFFTFRRSEYEKTEKIDPSLSSAVDQDLYLKMYEMGEFQFIDLPLYKYRLHEKGVSQDKSKKQKLYSNWNKVLINALGRRKIEVIYGRKVSEIDNLAMFIFQKENTYIKKIQRKISCLFKSS